MKDFKGNKITAKQFAKRLVEIAVRDLEVSIHEDKAMHGHLSAEEYAEVEKFVQQYCQRINKIVE